MPEVTKDTIVAQVMEIAPESQPLFLEIGMHCLGCAYATGESIEEACMAHGVDADAFLEKLNAFLATL